MNEKTKAILDYLKDDEWDYYPSDGIPYKVFLCEERDILLDYITNLENKNKGLKESVNNLLKLCEEVIKENEGLYNHLCLEMRKNDGGDKNEI